MNRLEMINELAKHPEKKFYYSGAIVSRTGNDLMIKYNNGICYALYTGIFSELKEYEKYEEIKEEPTEQVNSIIEEMIKRLERMKVE